MVHGAVQAGTIVPLDPIPADWKGRRVVIEPAADATREERAEIERWDAELARHP